VMMADVDIKRLLADAICDDTQWSRATPSKFIWDRVDAILPTVKQLMLNSWNAGYERRDDEVKAALA
jgi:hypothetical protein